MPTGVYDHSIRKLQFCLRGHDTSVTGRERSGRCYQCRKDRNRVYPNYKRSRRENNWKKAGILNADGSFFTGKNFDWAYTDQEGKCAVCLRPESELRTGLYVDHDHKTGIFRGLLCREDNVALGFVKDSSHHLNRLINYLESQRALPTW